MPRPLRFSWWWVIRPALVIMLGLLDHPRNPRPAHRAEWLDAGDAAVRTVRGGNGDTTLVLIHGFGESLFGWRAVFDQLATHYRVVAFDLPGFGGSGKPDAPYTLAAMTDRLAEFVDRWTTGPIVVVGHSMGGQLAASLAMARPNRIVAAVLIAPSGWNVGLSGIADTMYPGKARAIGWYLAGRAFVLPEHDTDWLGEPKAAAAYTLMTDSNYRRATSRVLEEFDFRGLRERWADLRQPVLLIWGTGDPVIPFEISDSLLARIPCARRLSLPALHRPQVEIPDTVSAEIARFSANPTCPRPEPAEDSGVRH